ncbi:MAG: winged helix-turn-helix domain-containing protein [Candidatus Bathyarchaeota archaeon]
MSKKRTDVEIFADILRLTVSEKKISHIVYQTNLNFKVVNKYLDWLIKSNFIKRSFENKVFKTTEKGLGYLTQFDDFQKYSARTLNNNASSLISASIAHAK